MRAPRAGSARTPPAVGGAIGTGRLGGANNTTGYLRPLSCLAIAQGACLAPPAPANWDPAAWPLLPSLTRRSGEEQRAARNRDGWAAAG